MKRYLLFSGSVYYPSGGWIDFKGSFDTGEEAFESFKSRLDKWEEIGRFVWYHIVDSKTWEIVRGSRID